MITVRNLGTGNLGMKKKIKEIKMQIPHLLNKGIFLTKKKMIHIKKTFNFWLRPLKNSNV
jgi:hypothetical protein